MGDFLDHIFPSKLASDYEAALADVKKNGKDASWRSIELVKGMSSQKSAYGEALDKAGIER